MDDKERKEALEYLKIKKLKNNDKSDELVDDIFNKYRKSDNEEEIDR